ncbi:MAG TPA: type II asparaginase [Polyangiaceae bacterium]|nr:type II asparaginase [Polyangiaceae bacterium]
MRKLFRWSAPALLGAFMALAGLATPGARQAEAQTASKTEKAPAKLKSIKILATGGTIAGAGTAGGYGYKAGSFKVEDLIKAVPNMDKLARLGGEQVANIGSQDMNDEVWLKLAKRANQVLDEAGTNGIVITHGTDTLEETSYFLHLVLKSEKPVVMVGSMRPATATSADGPANLYDAVAAATDDNARGRGVMVVLNDEIHSARNVIKTNTTSLQTFESPMRGPLGFVHTGKIDWFERMNKRHTSQSEFSVDNLQALPRVDIIYAHSNMSVDLIQAAIDRGAKGIVVAGVGDGNMSKAALDLLAAAVKRGVVVVRASRVESGIVLRNNEVDDDKMGFVASAELNPPKSRVLLQLALTKTTNPKDVQRMFNEY